MRSLQLGDNTITDDSPPLIIAEIGINHNGSISEAISMASLAIDAGAKYIKVQTHISAAEMSADAKTIIPQHTTDNIFSIIESCELTYDEECKLSEFINSRGCHFISTPFSLAAVERVASHNPPFFKIGSGEFNNLPLLELCLKYNKPLVLSTGMNDLASIDHVVQFLNRNHAQYALLHCTNLYPTPDKYVRLGCITQMRERYPNTVIGLSDHTISNYACYGATALGAGILERHFTDSKKRVGPDISNSMTPEELTELIHVSKVLSKQRWGDKTQILEAEDDTRKFAFASVVSARDIPPDTILSAENLTVKRPGTGDFMAAAIYSLIGKKSATFIPADTQILHSHIR